MYGRCVVERLERWFAMVVVAGSNLDVVEL